ncbi:MAG: hypothetical protein WC740_21400 [Verrucomicrobiia bacterium]
MSEPCKYSLNNFRVSATTLTAMHLPWDGFYPDKWQRLRSGLSRWQQCIAGGKTIGTASDERHDIEKETGETEPVRHESGVDSMTGFPWFFPEAK